MPSGWEHLNVASAELKMLLEGVAELNTKDKQVLHDCLYQRNFMLQSSVPVTLDPC